MVFFPVIPYQQCILWTYSVFSGKSPLSFSYFSSLVPGLALSFLRSDCKVLSYSLTTTNEGGDFSKRMIGRRARKGSFVLYQAP